MLQLVALAVAWRASNCTDADGLNCAGMAAAIMCTDPWFVLRCCLACRTHRRIQCLHVTQVAHSTAIQPVVHPAAAEETTRRRHLWVRTLWPHPDGQSRVRPQSSATRNPEIPLSDVQTSVFHFTCNDLASVRALRNATFEYASHRLTLVTGQTLGSAQVRHVSSTRSLPSPLLATTARAVFLSPQRDSIKAVLAAAGTPVPFRPLFISCAPWGGMGGRRLGLAASVEIAGALGATVLVDPVGFRSRHLRLFSTTTLYFGLLPTYYVVCKLI